MFVVSGKFLGPNTMKIFMEKETLGESMNMRKGG